MIDDSILEILREKTQIEGHCDFMLSLLHRYSWPEARVREITATVDRILRRQDDPNLYLGVIGEFSAGKTTFLNCLLQRDFLKTHAVQGTTTIPTDIRYGEQVDLVVELRDGKILHYREDEMLIWDLAKRITEGAEFQSMGDPETAIAYLTRALTTGAQPSRVIKQLTLYYPADILSRGIVIIDTPGTDSLETDDLRLTEAIIRDRCDLSLVVIPAEKPATASLLTFLKDYIPGNLHRCRFLLTKVELLRKKDREMVSNSLRNRLTQYLGLSDVTVIPAPTLLLQEERQWVEASGLTDGLGSEDKRELTANFEEAIKGVFLTLQQESVLVLTERLILVMDELLVSLQGDLDAFEASYAASNELLQQNRISDLNVFIDDCKAELARYTDIDNSEIIQLLKDTIQFEEKMACTWFGDMIRGAWAQFGYPRLPDSSECDQYLRASLRRITAALTEQTASILEEAKRRYHVFGDVFRKRYENLAALQGTITNTAPVIDRQLFSAVSIPMNFHVAQTHVRTGMVETFFGGLFKRDTMSDDDKYIELLTKTADDLTEYYRTVVTDMTKEIFKRSDETARVLGADLDKYKTAYARLVRDMIDRDEKEGARLRQMRLQVRTDRSALAMRIEDLETVKELFRKI